MRGHPIVTDTIPSTLSDMERRLDRLEHPHKINYAQRFGWIARSSFTSQPQVSTQYLPIDTYLGVVGGPSALWVLESNWGTGGIEYEVTYLQRHPTPATAVNTLASGTVATGAGPSTILVDTEAAQIVGTFGLMVMYGKVAVPATVVAGYTLWDSGFITPEYEIITS